MTRSDASTLERERKRQDRLIKLVSIHGDEGRAAGVMGLSREELLQLLKDEVFRKRIEIEKAKVANERGWLEIIYSMRGSALCGSASNQSQGPPGAKKLTQSSCCMDRTSWSKGSAGSNLSGS